MSADSNAELTLKHFMDERDIFAQYVILRSCVLKRPSETVCSLK